MFEKKWFEPGKVVFDDMQIDENASLDSQIDNLKEDLYQVNYDDKYIIDVGWFPSFSLNGHFRVVIIKDFDWESPIFQKKCRTFIELREFVEEAANIAKSKL